MVTHELNSQTLDGVHVETARACLHQQEPQTFYKPAAALDCSHYG